MVAELFAVIVGDGMHIVLYRRQKPKDNTGNFTGGLVPGLTHQRQAAFSFRQSHQDWAPFAAFNAIGLPVVDQYSLDLSFVRACLACRIAVFACAGNASGHTDSHRSFCPPECAGKSIHD